MSGIQDKGAQALVLAINNALGSVVMDANSPRLIRQENGGEVKAVVDAVIMNAEPWCSYHRWSNPAYTLPNATHSPRRNEKD